MHKQILNPNNQPKTDHRRVADIPKQRNPIMDIYLTYLGNVQDVTSYH